MLLYIIRNDKKIKVGDVEVIYNRAYKKTLKVNNEIVLTKYDKIIYQCDETKKICENYFHQGDRFIGKTYSPSIYKKKNTLKKYGVDNPAKLDEVKNKISKTKNNKTQEEKNKINEKRKKTNLNKYNVESTNSLECVKEKKKRTWLKKYGVDNPNKTSEIKDKIKYTKYITYGDKNYNNRDKYERTCLKRYGVKNARKNKTIKSKIRETQNNNYYNNLSNRVNNKIIPLFNTYLGTDYHIKYKWKCNTCDTIFYDNLYSGNIPSCPMCFPRNRSRYEYDIEKFLINNNFIYKKNFKNKKYGIFPFELDFYLPDYTLAIEFNGAYWHSIKFITDKWYHQKKVKMCHDKGIRLLHIWEDEWLDDKEKIKEKILYYINNLNEEIKPREPILEKRMGYKIWN